MPVLVNILYGIYLCFVILLDFLCNGFVLYATVAHKAIKLDKVCIWIIQNLALIDIANGVFVIIPIAMSLFAERKWILGSVSCRIFLTYKFCFVVGNIFLINFMSLNKLLRCLFPLRNLVYNTSKQKLGITLITIMFMLIGPVRKVYLVFVTETAQVRYSPKHGVCVGYQIVDDVEEYLNSKFERILCFFIFILPCIFLIITTTCMMIFAVRTSNSAVNKKNILAVFLVTFIFIATFVPFLVIYQMRSKNLLFVSRSMLISSLIGFTSSFCNPFIYLATNQAFRKFTGPKLGSIFCRPISRICVNIHEEKQKVMLNFHSKRSAMCSAKSDQSRVKKVVTNYGNELEENQVINKCSNDLKSSNITKVETKLTECCYKESYPDEIEIVDKDYNKDCKIKDQ